MVSIMTRCIDRSLKDRMIRDELKIIIVYPCYLKSHPSFFCKSHSSHIRFEIEFNHNSAQVTNIH